MTPGSYRPLIVGLGLVQDGPDSWSGPLQEVKVPGSTRTVLTWRTRLAGPAARLPWRRASFDTVFFRHDGGALHVIDADSAATTREAWQQSVPAGHWHRVTLGEPGYALWSEAYLSEAPEVELLPPAEEPAPLPAVSTVAGLDLTAHIEGGYYRQIYESSETLSTPVGPRSAANTIYYLLDEASPTGYLHLNVSDITHFLHGPGGCDYTMVAPDGSIHRRSLGLDVAAGQVPAFTCPGGWWKTSTLAAGADHGLISEIVAPGFHFDDQRLADVDGFAAAFPHLVDGLAQYIRH